MEEDTPRKSAEEDELPVLSASQEEVVGQTQLPSDCEDEVASCKSICEKCMKCLDKLNAAKLHTVFTASISMPSARHSCKVSKLLHLAALCSSSMICNGK